MGADDNRAMDMQIPATGEVSLEHLGVIRARGADATRFLQGQLTNDVAALGLGQARLAGFCSAKGRLQASFIVWKSVDDEVLLACSASVLAATLKRLSMFVLRAQCKLSDATAEMRLRGQIGSAAAQSIGAMRAWEQRDDNGAIGPQSGLGLKITNFFGTVIAAATLQDAALKQPVFHVLQFRRNSRTDWQSHCMALLRVRRIRAYHELGRNVVRHDGCSLSPCCELLIPQAPR